LFSGFDGVNYSTRKTASDRPLAFLPQHAARQSVDTRAVNTGILLSGRRRVSMTNITMVRKIDRTAGRVVLGPKKIRGGYARIVSEADGCGCIQVYDPVTESWFAADEQVTFGEVWSAPAVSMLQDSTLGHKSAH
jgi:hypothetical protein